MKVLLAMIFNSDTVRKMARDPIETARQAKERKGLPVVGALSSWIPASLIVGAGAFVLRMPAGEEVSRTGAHFQASSCFYCRSVLDAAIAKKLDFLDAMVFVQTCDTQQNLSDIWKLVIPNILAIDIYMPVNRTFSGAKEFLISQLAAAGQKLGDITQKRPDEASLQDAFEQCAKVENALEKLYRIRLGNRLNSMDHYGACMASSCLPPGEGASLIEGLLDSIELNCEISENPNCILAGSTLPYPGLFEALDDLNVDVVDDDLSIGRRLFDYPHDKNASPINQLADQMLRRSKGATKHDDKLERADRLTKIVERVKTDHVIFPILKFCDPWMWDYPILADAMTKISKKSLLLELGQKNTDAPTADRIKAFMESTQPQGLFHE